MTRIFDNITERLDEHLLKTLAEFQRMDAAVGYFSLRGWRVFQDLVENKPFSEVPTARILIGMALPDPHTEDVGQLEDSVTEEQPVGAGADGVLEADGDTARRRRDELVSHLRTQLMRGIPTSSDRYTLRKLREMLDSGKVAVKVFTRRPLHGKTYLFHRTAVTAPIVGFVGSSNLTSSGLAHNYELNVDVMDSDGAQKLADWFTARWDDKFSFDVTSDLLDLIDDSWASPTPRSPYEVFVKVCYDLSRDMREGIAEFGVPREIDGILLPFQRTAVQILARRIMSRGGAMLSDVVGLGKTLTTIAVALVLRQEGVLPLIVCPRNLVGMWEAHLN